MSLVEKVLDVALQPARTRRMRRDLAGLARSDPAYDWLWTALHATIDGVRTPEETARVERIEQLRRRLAASREVVSRVDYGARSPGARLTDEMMYRGETVTATVGDICRVAANPTRTALLLFHLIRGARPGTCLEMGTSLGITAAYQASALALNGAGRLVTLEGAETIAALARQNLASLGLEATVIVGRFQDTLDSVLREHGPIDFAFVDGHHDEGATIRYFDQLRPALAPRAVVVFDDIGWSDGMGRAWTAIAGHPEIGVAVDLGAMGVCVLGAPRRPPLEWRVL
jgi:predicted O-methyltransferase YrrM